MRRIPWFGTAAELCLMIAAALVSVAAIAQDAKKPEEIKPAPPAAEGGAKSDIRLREPASAPEPPAEPPRRGPRPSEYWIGLECYPAQGALIAQLGLPEGQGLVVESVAPEGPAAKAGLRRHDILLASGDTKLRGLDDLGTLVAASKDKQISFQVLRSGKTVTVDVQPAKRPIARAGDGGPQFEERIHERLGHPGGPFRLRFFHPGVVVRVGDGRFPSDVSVSVTKEGTGPTRVEVKQGDQNWSVTADNVGDLPATVRGFAEQLLGGGLGDLLPFRGGAASPAPPHVGPLSEAPPAVVPGVPVPAPAATGPLPPPARPAGPPAANPRVEERLEAMQRRMEEMHQELQDLRSRRPAPPEAPRVPPRDEAKPKSENY